jgi:hypothetical protein
MLILAAVAEPYNKIVWREIRAWALINNTAFNLVYLPIPPVAKDDAIQTAQPARGQPPQLLSAWRAYHSVIADWRNGRVRKAVSTAGIPALAQGRIRGPDGGCQRPANAQTR